MPDDTIDIVTYRPDLQPHFERLNRIWLEEHALLEPVDLEYLQDPEGHILAPGGEVFFATRGDEVVGTCAAIPIAPGVWELAKLAVAPEARGHGLGRRLCEVVLEYARAAGGGRDRAHLAHRAGGSHPPLRVARLSTRGTAGGRALRERECVHAAGGGV